MSSQSHISMQFGDSTSKQGRSEHAIDTDRQLIHRGGVPGPETWQLATLREILEREVQEKLQGYVTNRHSHWDTTAEHLMAISRNQDQGVHGDQLKRILDLQASSHQPSAPPQLAGLSRVPYSISMLNYACPRKNLMKMEAKQDLRLQLSFAFPTFPCTQTRK